MPYVSPAAVVSGAVISKTTFGDVVKADLDYLANPPSCRVFTTSTLAVGIATWTAVPFDSESWDTTGAMHSTSTNNSRITVPDLGLYLVEGVVCFAHNATGIRLAGLRVNSSGGATPAWGTNYTNTIAVAGIPTHIPTVATIKMAANDFVELVCWQNTAGTLALGNENGDNHLSVTWIGRG